MGLLDRWNKKTTSQQIKTGETKAVVAGAKAKAKSDATALSVSAMPKHLSAIIRPLVTEKGAHSEALNKYVFAVAKNANKTEIKTAIKNMYDVMPTSVNIVNVQGKNMRFGRSLGRRSDVKKAIVTLPKGKTLTIHEGV